MNPLVSVVITTHNRIELLPRAIDSVLEQSYSNIECIVVSDNSTDGTNEYCRERNDIFFIDIPSSESRGGNHARNVGISLAKGEYVAFLDDDDYWLSSKIEKQMDLIQSRKCGVVYCGMRVESVNHDGSITYSSWLPTVKNCGDLSKRIFTSICTNTSALLIKRDLFDSVGYFDEDLRFWQEYELCIRLAQKSPFYYVFENLVVYRIDSSDVNRLSNKYYEWWDAVKYIRAKHNKLYSSLSLKYKRLANVTVYHDAWLRARKSNLFFEYIKYRFLFYFFALPEILHDKIGHALKLG